MVCKDSLSVVQVSGSFYYMRIGLIELVDLKLCLWRMCDSLVIRVVPAQGANGKIMVPGVHLLIMMKPSIIQLTWCCSLVGSLRR